MNAVLAGRAGNRVTVAAGMAAIALLAWTYVWTGAGMGMSALDMTSFALFPHRQPDTAAGMGLGWTTLVVMWWVMMVAMMTPSALPLVLLYGRVLAHHGGRTAIASWLLLLGYLTAWLVFSVLAAAAQVALEPAGLAGGMMAWSRSAALSATVLALAGAYQLSPLKHACLSQCRSPLSFLMRYGSTRPSGAFRLGLRHGAFCVGCCWLLMALLLVFGVMNLVWIALLTGLVLAEKLLPPAWNIPRISGVLLLAWAVATLLQPR